MTEPLTLHEEEVLDVLRDVLRPSGRLYADELRKCLGWGTNKLYPILAGLTEKGLLSTGVDQDYPYSRWYAIK